MAEYDSLLGNGGAVPSGGIIMWSGSIDDIPEGWTLCDGTDGAPDLQDRFIVGAGNQYNVGETDGEDQVSLSEGELPSHNHGDGSLSASNHDHGNGNLSADGHRHGDGSLSASNHDHGSGGLSVSSHDHGSGNLTADSGPSSRHQHTYEIYEGDFRGGDLGHGDSERSLSDRQETSYDGSHSHNVSGRTGDVSPDVTGSTSSTSPSVSGRTDRSGANVSGSTSSSSPSVSGSTGSTGNNNAHENRPPYFAVAYIMKLPE